MARRVLVTSLLYPVLACAFLSQVMIPLARIATTYLVFDLDVSLVYVSLNSACYALLPALFAFPIGRLYDRGHVRPLIIAGAWLGLVAVLTLFLGQASLAAIVAGTMLLGFGQSVIVSAMQLLVVRSSGFHHRDRVLGLHMLALSIGTLASPLTLFIVDRLGLPLAPSLLHMSLGAAAALLVGVLFAARAVKQTHRREQPQVAFRKLIGVPRLVPLVVLGSGYLTTTDLLLVFLPVLGAQRGISPGVVGLMIATQSAGSIGARALFGWLAGRLGRERLLLASSMTAAVGLLGIGAPMPLPVVWVCLLFAGISLSLAMTASVSLVVQTAPPAARGTALSMRFTANRTIQFAVPLASSLVIASVGAAGIFLMLGLLLSLSTAGLWRVLSPTGPR